MLSARNQFEGTVKAVKVGNVMAEVVVAVGNLEFVSAITRGLPTRASSTPSWRSWPRSKRNRCQLTSHWIRPNCARGSSTP